MQNRINKERRAGRLLPGRKEINMEITLNVTESEAKRIIRALERSRCYWSSPEMILKYDTAIRISFDYRDLAKKVIDQVKEQVVEP